MKVIKIQEIITKNILRAKRRQIKVYSLRTKEKCTSQSKVNTIRKQLCWISNHNMKVNLLKNKKLFKCLNAWASPKHDQSEEVLNKINKDWVDNLNKRCKLLKREISLSEGELHLQSRSTILKGPNWYSLATQINPERKMEFNPYSFHNKKVRMMTI